MAKRIQKIKTFLPELYLIISVIYYWTLTAVLLNPLAIILIGVLIYQIISKNSGLGIIIATIFVGLNCYLILALFSEFSEFSEFNIDAKKLAIFGFLYISLNCIVGVIMIIKYMKINNIKNQLS